MTKKNIWVKLLIVALIIAMVGAFFIACDDKEKPNTPPDDGNNNNDGQTDEAVNALLGVIDDAIAALGGIDNVGNLGTDAYIDLAMEQEGVTKKIRIDLDLSLDLLNETTAGENYSAYSYNGFGFTISVDEGDGSLDRVFGVWYVDDGADADNFIYLSAGGQNLKIDALTLASVLEKYAVNANVEVGSVLNNFGSLASNPDVSGILAMLPTLGINIGYEKVGNNEVFSLNIKELFNPSEDNALGLTLNDMIFQNEDIAGVLSALKIGITSVGDIYNMIPNVSLEVIGNYDANGTFESIGLGLAVDGKSDGITIPTTEGDGLTIVEGSFPDTDLSATLGFKILSGEESFNNVVAVRDEAIADTTWNEIGVINVALESQLVIGKDKDSATTYDLTLSADINAAAIASATFTKPVWYVNDNGEYYKNEDGTYKTKDMFYLQGDFFDSTELDVIDILLSNINSLYLNLEEVTEDGTAGEAFTIALTDKIVYSQGGTISEGGLYVKFQALKTILGNFGIDLSSILGGALDGVFKYDGQLGKEAVSTLISLVKGILPGLIYTSDVEGYELTSVAPADASASSLNMADAATDTEGDDDVMTIIMEVINKVMACVSVNSDAGSITAAGSGADYTIKGAVLDFDIVAALMKDAEGAVNGVKVDVNKLVADYNDGEVVTSVNGNIQIGGGELFKAVVSVDQNKSGEDAFDIYIGITLDKIGYGCAATTPVELGADNKPVNSLYKDGVGWVASK